jgi:hypothetical protein
VGPVGAEEIAVLDEAAVGEVSSEAVMVVLGVVVAALEAAADTIAGVVGAAVIVVPEAAAAAVTEVVAAAGAGVVGAATIGGVGAVEGARVARWGRWLTGRADGGRIHSGGGIGLELSQELKVLRQAVNRGVSAEKVSVPATSSNR